jgi:hypothetical protein
MSETSQLQDLLRGALLAYSSEMPVSAETLAGVVIDQIDAEGSAPILVRWGCVLELRQLARPMLRREFEQQDIDQAQGELFEGLQDRYPGVGDHKGMYVPRQMMTLPDYDANIARLRHEAEAKQKHADALAAERDEKVRLGFFADAA